MRRMILALTAFALLAPGLSHAQSGQPSYWIIKPEPGRAQDLPEPWLAPKYKSPRGTRQHVKPLRRAAEPDQPRVSTPPPPIVVPETGVALPNMRTLSPSGPPRVSRTRRCAARIRRARMVRPPATAAPISARV
jgi:hypothetical protein